MGPDGDIAMGDAAAGDSLVQGFDYRLRPWEPADRDEVIALIIGIQRGEFNLPITPSDQPDLADIARFYRAGGGEFWVAIYRGSVVGTIAALKSKDRRGRRRATQDVRGA